MTPHRLSGRTSLMTSLGPPVVLLILFLVHGAPAQAYPMREPFYRLTEDYVSPHIAWAKPYIGGPVKVLFIVPRGTAREVIELAERLSMDYTVVMTLSDKELGWTSKSSHYATAEGISYDEMARETRDKLKGDYDVIVTGLIQWDMFPRDVLYTIMKKIHDGTGLLHCYAEYGRNARIKQLFAKPEVPAPDDFVTTGVPFAALPVFRELGAEKIVQLRRFKQGRMALLSYDKRPRFLFLTPNPGDDDESYRELYYEYYQSLAIKALLWAAKKEPPVRFRSITVGADQIRRADLPNTQLVAALTGDFSAELKAQIIIRDENGHVHLTAVRKDLKVPGGEVRLALPLLPDGRYFADVRLWSKDRTVNWATAAFTVISDPSVESVVLDKPSVRPGEQVTATVKLAGKVPSGATVRLEVVDTAGRLIVREKRAARAGQEQITFPFRVARPLTLLADVKATLQHGDEAISSRSAELVFLLRRKHQYAHAVWSADSNGNEFVRRLMYRQIRDQGVDMFTNSSVGLTGQRNSSRHDFDTIPYITRYFYSGTDPIRKPCLTDPKWLPKHLAELEDKARALAPYGPRAYTLGDECFLARENAEVCFSPSCLAEFRQWLQSEYQSLQALNESWGTQYNSFDEAEPLKLADAREAKSPPRWVDHRRFMEFVYARMMARARQAIRKADPGAAVGFDGPFTTTSRSGNDWWRLMEVFDLCTLYEQADEWEAVRSFAKPGTLLGLWYGGYWQYRTEDQERFFPWRGLMNGFNSAWWYAVYHGLSTCPMDALTPSMTVYPEFRWASEEIAEIKAGAGPALLNSQRRHDGIATHYSQPSLHMATWDPEFGQMYTVWRQLYAVLEDLGLQYNCYSYAQLEQHGLDAQEYPVFILPYSQAISRREAAALHKYVAAGGMLLADVRPGVADQHGKPQQPGLLDDLFGIERYAGRGKLSDVTGTITKSFENFKPQVTLEKLSVDANVRVKDAQALGEAEGVPIVIVKRSGQGLAVLLNYSFGAAFRERTSEAGPAHWSVLSGLLALNKVAAEVHVTGAAGPLRMLEIVRYMDGPARYMGLLKWRVNSEEQPVEATISTPRRLHTYDMRTGEYLGNVQNFSANFVPSRAKLFARLPYRIKGLQARLDKRTYSPGGLVKCGLRVTATGQPGRHWVQVKVLGPDGGERRCHRQTVAAPEGRGSVTIPLALNAPQGAWKLVAREAISNRTATANFTVR